MAFDEHIAAVAMHPVMGYPVRMRMRRTVPTAGNPDIASSVPAVVSVDPDVFTPWSRAAGFDDRGGRSYADHDLRKRGGGHQSSSEQQSWKKFLHVRSSWVSFGRQA
jgi:hypothetical protein